MLEYLLNLADLAVKCDMILTSRALGASASLRELLQRGFSRALGVSAPLQEMSGDAGRAPAVLWRSRRGGCRTRAGDCIDIVAGLSRSFRYDHIHTYKATMYNCK